MPDTSVESSPLHAPATGAEGAIDLAILTVSGDNAALSDQKPSNVEAIVIQDATDSASTVPKDNCHEVIIQQVNHLKTKNNFNHENLTRIYEEVNQHLFECNDHHLQIVQYKFVFGTGNSRIIGRPDGSINHFNNEKIVLATKVLEFDIKRVKSLGAFFVAQKRYFNLLGEMKEIEVEIKQLLASAIETGAAPDGFYDEMEETRGRIANMEESRIGMREGWLEWLDELS
ncbi:unnamed protein product [Aureobasidium vineae]|uniref:Uncharacterized protein n=1 Tax=Aureobasidium vineae TaxID=2773715 RepID=A0A9N8JW70_9PEZI|nr:unnamed protein product [Aureobasidium vineae]